VRPAVALKRHRPGESRGRDLPAEVYFNAGGTIEHLRSLPDGRLAMLAIQNATKEVGATQAGAPGSTPTQRRRAIHPISDTPRVADVRSGTQRRTRALTGGPSRDRVGSPPDRTRAIGDRRLCALGTIDDTVPPSAVSMNVAVRGTKDGVRWKREFGESVQPEHARAVHGHADLVVLFEHDDVVAARGENAGGGQSRGTGADDGNITHGCRSVLAPAHLPCALQANPK
jgi:hypothetical protein